MPVTIDQIRQAETISRSVVATPCLHSRTLSLEIEKTLAEGAAAACLAAVLTHRERFLGKRVGLVLSGGNIDPLMLAGTGHGAHGSTDAAHRRDARSAKRPGRGDGLSRRIERQASVGHALVEDVLLELRRVLGSVFDADIIAVSGILLPSAAYDGKRRQYHSTPILQQLARAKPRYAERLLGVADVDLYVPELNCVFGEADAHRGVAVFSLARLHTDGSDQRARALFLTRAATEAVHELGHTYRLDHCANSRCAMWFSNTLAETDRKGSALCAVHAAQLTRVRSRA